MTPSPPRRTSRLPDLFLALAALALGSALAYTRVERAILRRTIEAALADVGAVSQAAAAHFRETGAWPAPALAGVVPPELVGRLPPQVSFERGSYTLQWGRWEAWDQAALPATAPPPLGTAPSLPPPPDSMPEVQAPPLLAVGTVTVHAPDERLLAALLERTGSRYSFVGEKSWTLVVLPAGGTARGSALR